MLLSVLHIPYGRSIPFIFTRIPSNLYVDEIRGAVSNMHSHARPLYKLPQCVESRGDTHSMGMPLARSLARGHSIFKNAHWLCKNLLFIECLICAK